MKTTILATVSVIALMGAMPTITKTVHAQTPAEKSASENMADDAKEAISDIKEGASDAIETITATYIANLSPHENISVVVDPRKTANGIIGHPVYNEKHESIAKVTDIILDKNGNAAMVIVADGEFIGLGKKAAFYYSAITRVEEDGDVIMPLTEKIIDDAAAFSYDKADGSDKVLVIPDNGYSVVKLLDGKLVNQKMEAVADVENITLKNAKAHQIILGFDKTMGLGGEKALINFADAAIVSDKDQLHFQLNAEKTTQFEAYKKAVTK